MMRTILLVKTSSLGDVLHLLPALSDAHQRFPDLTFHWVVEEGLAEIATWHPAVTKIIPVAVRRWRTRPWQAWRSGEIATFLRTLRADDYPMVIDAQGLIKSAVLARLARGRRIGFDQHSARESWAARFYHTPLHIPQEKHALERLRHLFAEALHYPVPSSPPDYGLAGRFGMRETGRQEAGMQDIRETGTQETGIQETGIREASTQEVGRPETGIRETGTQETDPPQSEEAYWVFLHGTTWSSKHWPEACWVALAQHCAPHGRVILPWGNAREEARASRIASVVPDRVFPAGKTTLTQLATLLAGARAVVAVDTGPGHLAAALGRPVIGLYGATNPHRTGTLGLRVQHHVQGTCDGLSSPQGGGQPPSPCLKRVCPMAQRAPLHPPCFQAITPEQVWNLLQALP